MKLTKKQILLNSGLAFLLVGGAVSGVVYNQHVQAEKAKQVQEEKKQALENAKQAEKELIKDAKEALLNAQKTPSTNNLELAKKAISNLKDEQAVKRLTKELESIKTRVKLEAEAKKAVSDYQKDAGNAGKLKKAQTAVSKLTSSYSKTLKAKLEKDIATSKAQAGTPQASASNGGAAYSDYAPAPAQNNSSYVAPTPSGGNVQTPAQPSTGGNAGVTPPTGGTPSNNGGSTSTPTPAPTPAVTYTGWVRNRAGQIVWSQGGFKTLDEAATAAARWANAQPNPEDAWSSGAY